jgi:hypothetical protein
MAEHAKYQDIPLWLGESPLAGKTILIYAEQGFGDAIQMYRFLPLIESHMGAKVIFEVPRPLLRLMSSQSQNIQVIDAGAQLENQFNGSIDFQCPIMSLPLAFRINMGSIPSDTPYLCADASLLNWWHDNLYMCDFSNRDTTKNSLKVGIAWSGSGHYAGKKSSKRDIPLNTLILILNGLNSRGVQVHSLQVPLKQELKSKLLEAGEISFHDKDIKDFADTAALISQLDLVISVDTAVAHLAGALDKPTVILTPDPPDFMSLTSDIKSIWYPSTTLIRQSERGNWNNVIGETFKLIDEKFL